MDLLFRLSQDVVGFEEIEEAKSFLQIFYQQEIEIIFFIQKK